MGPAGEAVMSDIDEQLQVSAPTADLLQVHILHTVRSCRALAALNTQSLLLSRLPANLDTARNLIASLLTRNFGEYVFRIGTHPSSARVFAGQSATGEDTWQGTPRTAEELDVIIQETTTVVDEVGGKVRLCLPPPPSTSTWTSTPSPRKTSILFDSRTDHPRAALLLRLPPPDVASTPEVRCAVVGNVDSGKSTTLGVLTRGMLFFS